MKWMTKALIGMQGLKQRLRREEGQGMVEYGLIIALVAVVVIGALVILGHHLNDLFNNVANNVANTGS